MNEEENLEVAKNNAEINYDRLIANLPRKIEEKIEDRESKLFEKIKRHKGNPENKLKALYAEMDAIYLYVN